MADKLFFYGSYIISKESNSGTGSLNLVILDLEYLEQKSLERVTNNLWR